MITIKKCSAKEKTDIEYWYKDRIGEEFKIEWETFSYYFVKYSDGKKANFISKEDIC